MPAKKISDLQKEKYHSEGGVADFKLQIASQDAKSWILRVKVGSKRFLWPEKGTWRGLLIPDTSLYRYSALAGGDSSLILMF